MDRTYVCQGHTFEFYFHGTHMGYHPRLAVCVKNYAPRDRLEPFLEQLLDDHPDVKDRLELNAWENTQEEWWDWATGEAYKYKIYSCGRSGGWLYFDKYDPERIEELADGGNLCDDCGQGWEAHPTAECSRFVHAGTELDTLKELEGLCKMFADSLKQVPAHLADSLRFLIEDEEDLQERTSGVL